MLEKASSTCRTDQFGDKSNSQHYTRPGLAISISQPRWVPKHNCGSLSYQLQQGLSEKNSRSLEKMLFLNGFVTVQASRNHSEMLTLFREENKRSL